jgi:hypothetical protein
MFIGSGCSIFLLLLFWLIIIQYFYARTIINKSIQLLKLNILMLSLITNSIYWNWNLKCFIFSKFGGEGSGTDYFKWGNLTRKSNNLKVEPCPGTDCVRSSRFHCILNALHFQQTVPSKVVRLHMDWNIQIQGKGTIVPLSVNFIHFLKGMYQTCMPFGILSAVGKQLGDFNDSTGDEHNNLPRHTGYFNGLYCNWYLTVICEPTV